MKLCRLALALVLTCTSVAYASLWDRPCRPWYVGVGGNQNGVFQYGDDSRNLEEDMKSAFGGHFFFGYSFYRWFSLEAGFVYLGVAPVSDLAGSVIGALAVTYRERSWAAPFRARASIPLCSSVDIFFLAGTNFFSTTAFGINDYGFDLQGRERRMGMSTTLGIGVQGKICDTFALRGGFNRYGMSTSLDAYKTTLELSIVGLF